MSKLCGISGCTQPVHNEGVCFFHFPLWEHWGYDLGGYQCYSERGRSEGRRRFSAWLRSLGQQEIVNILSQYDWRLMNVEKLAKAEAHLK